MDVTLDAVPEQDRLSKPSAAAVVTKFEQRKEHRSVVYCNHHSWKRPTKLNTHCPSGFMCQDLEKYA